MTLDPRNIELAATPLGYESAAAVTRHSPFGIAALVLAVVAPALWGMALAGTAFGWADPPIEAQPVLLVVMIGGPFLALVLGEGSLFQRGRRRLPGVVAIVLTLGLFSFLLLAVFTTAI